MDHLMEVENAEEYPLISETENQNKAIVKTLYETLTSGGGDGTSKAAAGIIASNLEWWFYGPQKCHLMMDMLTGKSSPPAAAFKFLPRSVDAIGDRVIAEGWEGAQAYWVHVWAVKDGLITQFREYFHTWLIVTELRAVRCRTPRCGGANLETSPNAPCPGLYSLFDDSDQDSIKFNHYIMDHGSPVNLMQII